MTSGEHGPVGGESIGSRRQLISQQVGERALAVGVFCSARDLSGKLTEPARDLARMIGENGFDLVWGGSDVGTMHVISHEAREAGSRIIGVTTESLSRSQHKSADEMVVANDLPERKMEIVNRSDAIVVLPGGTGTLDEVADVIERKKFGEHYKPIIFLNADNFYDGLRIQFNRMEDEGMLNRPLSEIVDFAESAGEVMDLINQKQQHQLDGIFEAHDMVEHNKIQAGHSGALLFRTRTSQGERFVIKISDDKISTKEIKSNSRAYKQIKAEGPARLIPHIEVGEDASGRKYIIMPDLGETFSSQARSEAGADYRAFQQSVWQAFVESFKKESPMNEHSDSIRVAKDALRQYQQTLRTGGIPNDTTVAAIDKISADAISSGASSFFLLDFTPDNVFIYDGHVQFIDPWEQETYRGSPIVNLAQFQTLAKDIYGLPGVEDAGELFEALFSKIGDKLGLSTYQVLAQRNLGAALQFSLSSFTRLHSDPEKAHEYYKESDRAIQEVVRLQNTSN